MFYTTQNSFIWEGSVNKSRLLNTFSSAFMLIKMIVMNDDESKITLRQLVWQCEIDVSINSKCITTKSQIDSQYICVCQHLTKIN